MQVMDQVVAGYKWPDFKGRSENDVILVNQSRNKQLKFGIRHLRRWLPCSLVGDRKQEYVDGNGMRFHEEPGDSLLGQGLFLPGAKQK